MRKGQKEEEWVWAISVRGHPSDKWETRNLNLSHIQDFWAADTDAVNNELEGVQEEAVVVCFSQYPTITLVRLRKITKNNESGQSVARSKFEPRTQGIQWQSADHLATFGQTVPRLYSGADENADNTAVLCVKWIRRACTCRTIFNARTRRLNARWPAGSC
jgi:hypothetical protein